MRFSTLFIAVISTGTILPTYALPATPSSSNNHHHLVERDAFNTMAAELGAIARDHDGEHHGAAPIPPNSKLLSIPIGSKGYHVPVYWQARTNPKESTQAFIMIHGRLKNGNQYFTTMYDILQSALKDKYPGVDPNAIVVAPEFYSRRLNSGEYNATELAWDDINAWQPGEAAIHPTGATETSYDVLDELLSAFEDIKSYPKMKTVVFIGHGGGGQLINRYAVVNQKALSSHTNIRYVVGDPSSSPYFTKNRPTLTAEQMREDHDATKAKCPLYNDWRYGFDNFTGTREGLLTPQQYFIQSMKRDIRYVVGYNDTSPSGDQYCMAMLQGGSKRRDRNLIWWRYINTLAGTKENLDGFPGAFDKLPDWSQDVGGAINHTLTVIYGATHNAGEVFGSKAGRAVLFDDNSSTVPRGWRPAGWKAPPDNNGN